MGWIAVLAWVIAAVFALVVLGFAGYEVTWRMRRLRRELRLLAADGEQLKTVQRALSDQARRLRRAGGQ